MCTLAIMYSSIFRTCLLLWEPTLRQLYSIQRPLYWLYKRRRTGRRHHSSFIQHSAVFQQLSCSGTEASDGASKQPASQGNVDFSIQDNRINSTAVFKLPIEVKYWHSLFLYSTKNNWDYSILVLLLEYQYVNSAYRVTLNSNIAEITLKFVYE